MQDGDDRHLGFLKKFYNFWAVQPPIVTISDTEEASNVLFYTFGNYDILT